MPGCVVLCLCHQHHQLNQGDIVPRNPIDIQYSSHLANMTILASIDKLLEFNLHSYLSLPECLLLVSCFSNNLRPRQLPHCSVSHTHPPTTVLPAEPPEAPGKDLQSRFPPRLVNDPNPLFLSADKGGARLVEDLEFLLPPTCHLPFLSFFPQLLPSPLLLPPRHRRLRASSRRQILLLATNPRLCL